VNQTTATLILAVVGIALYSGCALRNRKALKADDLLAFGLWCGGAVVGAYMLLSALRLIKQTDEETTRLYVGIFGLVLMLLSLQKAYEMIRIALSKRHPQDKVPK
jgi:uncharacterized membrane protein YfcA